MEGSLEVMENAISVDVYLSIITGRILVPFNVSITANDGTAAGQYLQDYCHYSVTHFYKSFHYF